MPDASDSFILDRGPGLMNDYDNIIFDYHLYDQWDQCQSKVTGFLDAVQNEGMHILAGELGVGNGDSDTYQAMEYFYANDQDYDNLSWTPWAWYGGDDSKLTEPGGGFEIDDCQNPTNLTNFGQHTWDNSHDSSRNG